MKTRKNGVVNEERANSGDSHGTGQRALACGPRLDEARFDHFYSTETLIQQLQQWHLRLKVL